MPNVHKRRPRSIRLPADLDRLLTVYTETTGEAPNAVVSEAVRQFLASRGDVIEQAATVPNRKD